MSNKTCYHTGQVLHVVLYMHDIVSFTSGEDILQDCSLHFVTSADWRGILYAVRLLVNVRILTTDQPSKCAGHVICLVQYVPYVCVLHP